MKLAEALQERADLNRKIDDLRSRLSNSILVQDGEEPTEDPEMLLKDLDSSIARLEQLMASINLTNCRTKVNGKTLTEMIAKKDALMLKIAAYKNLVYEAGQSTRRARHTEIVIKATIKAADLQKTIDQMSKEARELDNTLQETNWKTKLIEK